MKTEAKQCRSVAPDFQPERDAAELSVRPLSLEEFIGQKKTRENLRVFIDAATTRKEPLDHVLLSGPPGLGKTTLAQIISREMGVGFRATSGPVISKAGDLAAILTNLQPHDVLFIDEIHRLNAAVEEILYPAMEDRQLDLIIGEGPSARSVRIDLPPFTLVAATTRSGLITRPLRERFGIPIRLEFYEPEELALIVSRASDIIGMDITPEGAFEIARRSRGTPRIAGRLTRRVRDFSAVDKVKTVDAGGAGSALLKLEVDKQGLDLMDRHYMRCIADNYGGNPAGIDTISAALSEQRDVLEEVVEPYLIQCGLIIRTPRGRMISDAGYKYMGLPLPQSVGNRQRMLEMNMSEEKAV